MKNQIRYISIRNLLIPALMLFTFLIAKSAGAQQHEVTSEDLWSLQSVTPPPVLKLGGQDFGQQDVAVKIKIKNKGKNDSKGEEVKMKIVFQFEGAEKALLEKEVTIKPSKTKSGKIYTETIHVKLPKQDNIEWPFDKMKVEVSGDKIGKLSKDIKVEKEK